MYERVVWIVSENGASYRRRRVDQKTGDEEAEKEGAE